MKFYESVGQALTLLQREGRVSYRALKREFDLDDEVLEDLKAEILEVKRAGVADIVLDRRLQIHHLLFTDTGLLPLEINPLNEVVGDDRCHCRCTESSLLLPQICGPCS
jgi:hypothetical protein